MRIRIQIREPVWLAGYRNNSLLLQFGNLIVRLGERFSIIRTMEVSLVLNFLTFSYHLSNIRYRMEPYSIYLMYTLCECDYRIAIRSFIIIFGAYNRYEYICQEYGTGTYSCILFVYL
jgi:hypothetical protein